jgi:calcineurin-like phosphoesterase family protein
VYYFTSDEHYGHANIVKYCNRPFKNAFEMDEELIKRHNELVGSEDHVIHGGDFTLHSNMKFVFERYVKRLNGVHIFIRGSHDKWLSKVYHEIWEKTIEKQHVVVCHYAMRAWPRSHYGSWQLYGHSHGGLEPYERQWDIGVDNNNFYPLSFIKISEIMKNKKGEKNDG